MTTKAALQWPNGATGAISITMDNMGEAADLNRGLWPSDKPVGSHYSVTSVLPKMLELLAERSIKATYFVEAWNCGIYVDTIRDVEAHGHEIGYHAWQHEVWKNLDPTTEISNLDKSMLAITRVLGKGYKGFRPPGGLVTDQTLTLMKERGFFYLSPAASQCAIVEGVAMVPFRWEDIDAYFYLPSLAPLRKRQGDSEDCLSAEKFKHRLLKRVDEVGERGGYASFLFHPFLTTGDERIGVMEEVLDYVKKQDRIWIAPCAEVSEWIHSHPQAFGDDPDWDNAEWKKA